jgi:hypothetical protein
MTESITIRRTTEADREALRRLAELDDGRAVADPFRYTLDVVRMLSARAEQERGDGSRRRLRWLTLGHRLGREGSAA